MIVVDFVKHANDSPILNLSIHANNIIQLCVISDCYQQTLCVPDGPDMQCKVLLNNYHYQ